MLFIYLEVFMLLMIELIQCVMKLWMHILVVIIWQ